MCQVLHFRTNTETTDIDLQLTEEGTHTFPLWMKYWNGNQIFGKKLHHAFSFPSSVLLSGPFPFPEDRGT